MEKNFLPLGSVVLLKDATKRIMIIGRVQIVEQVAYKYSGVLYPEGFLGADSMYVFNESDIDTVYSIGFQDTEEFEFNAMLTEKIKEQLEKNEDA